MNDVITLSIRRGGDVDISMSTTTPILTTAKSPASYLYAMYEQLLLRLDKYEKENPSLHRQLLQ